LLTNALKTLVNDSKIKIIDNFHVKKAVFDVSMRGRYKSKKKSTLKNTRLQFILKNKLTQFIINNFHYFL